MRNGIIDPQGGSHTDHPQFTLVLLPPVDVFFTRIFAQFVYTNDRDGPRMLCFKYLGGSKKRRLWAILSFPTDCAVWGHRCAGFSFASTFAGELVLPRWLCNVIC